MSDIGEGVGSSATTSDENSDSLSSCSSLSGDVGTGERLVLRAWSSSKYGTRKLNSFSNLGGFSFEVACPLLVFRRLRALRKLSLVFAQRSLHSLAETNRNY